MADKFSSNTEQSNRIHPLIGAAAVAVILVSAVAAASLPGFLPSSKANSPLPAASTGQPLPLVAAAAHDTRRAVEYREPVREHRRPPTPTSNWTYSDNSSEGSKAYQSAATAFDPYVGRVSSITQTRTPERPSGLGAIGGALVGGLAGKQIGTGRGRTLATIAGALGGGLAGNTIEGAVRNETLYRVRVRMGDGAHRDLTYHTEPTVRVGEQVRLVGDSLIAE